METHTMKGVSLNFLDLALDLYLVSSLRTQLVLTFSTHCSYTSQTQRHKERMRARLVPFCLALGVACAASLTGPKESYANHFSNLQSFLSARCYRTALPTRRV